MFGHASLGATAGQTEQTLFGVVGAAQSREARAHLTATVGQLARALGKVA